MKKEITVYGEDRENLYNIGVYALKVNGVVKYIGSGMMNDRRDNHQRNLRAGLYNGTNKQVLQDAFDNDRISMEVLHCSASNSEYLNATKSEQIEILTSIGIFEQIYYNIHKNTVCNCMKKITKHSTSPTPESTLKRSLANLAEKNPNTKYDSKVIANILFLKEIGVKPKEIMKHLQKQGIVMSNNYLYLIGKTKWLSLKSECPEWYHSDDKGKSEKELKRFFNLNVLDYVELSEDKSGVDEFENTSLSS